MKSFRPFLIALFLFALIPCAAMADGLDGVWLYSNPVSDYQAPSAYQQLYPTAEYQLTIEGSKVTVRAHQPYIYPFSLQLNENNGWFESRGTLNANNGTLEMIGGETLLVESSTDTFGTTTLILSGGSLHNIDASLEFCRSEEGLTFDVSSLYGSWTDYRGSWLRFDLPLSMAASYVSGSDEFNALHSFPESEDLYIREGCVTIVDPSYSSGGAYNMFSEKGRYALDITDLEVKDGGLFLELNGMKMKLYTGSDGFLRIVPLFSAQGCWAIAQLGIELNGSEARPMQRMIADVYSPDAEMPQGTWRLGSLCSSEEDLIARHTDALNSLMKEMSPVVFGENNAVTFSFGEAVITGTLSFPDPYTTENKDEHVLFSCEHSGFDLSLAMNGGTLVLNISKGGQFIIGFWLDPLNASGEQQGDFYYCLTYYEEDGNIYMGRDCLSTLQINADTTVVQTIDGETFTGSFITTGSYAEGDIAQQLELDGELYQIDHSGKLLRLFGETRMFTYSPIDPSAIPLLSDDSFIVFEFGNSVFTQGIAPDADTNSRLFNTFSESQLRISEDWSRVLLCQSGDMIFDEFITESEMLFMPDSPVNLLPIVNAALTEEVNSITLDLFGTEAVFTCTAGGNAELVIAGYHMPFEKLGGSGLTLEGIEGPTVVVPGETYTYSLMWSGSNAPVTFAADASWDDPDDNRENAYHVMWESGEQSENSFSIPFEKGGIYTVAITAVAENGYTDTTAITVFSTSLQLDTIYGEPSPKAGTEQVYTLEYTGGEGLMSFTAEVWWDAANDDEENSYSHLMDFPPQRSSAFAIPLPAPGTYEITIYAITATGCTDSRTVAVNCK